ncbi:peptide-methionine (S)-S-oxide reductase [Aequorivita capsosiphonis]|uniref:peptide-methionine (S)-S-oxide reductase n=1 Tax=Aequorivita capsosiphonis TaxID=487317 RepID=UPI000425813B|nr:peptide-methionine (S)-S-oxide reductase [Aequorivita capsosiphonis]
MRKIAFGGGCHWCTEAVFQSLKGVESVEQGYIASTGEETSFSEAVIVHFNPEIISIKILIEIHLLTHKSTSNHSMRNKYRSAVYSFSKRQNKEVQEIITFFQKKFENKVITKTYPFSEFKPSREPLQNYYYSNPNKPFCEKFIDPKLKFLLKNFGDHLQENRLD